MERRIACVGDVLSTGGKVLPYSGRVCTFGNSGHQVALIGGDAYCEACKSIGKIAKAGGPHRIEFMGETAADWDIVLCKCTRSPHIIALLAGNSWCDDMAEGEWPKQIHDIANDNFGGEDVEILEQYFQLIDGDTGEPATGYRYDMYSNGDRVTWKAPLSGGLTASVSGNCRVSLVMWLDKSGENRP